MLPESKQGNKKTSKSKLKKNQENQKILPDNKVSNFCYCIPVNSNELIICLRGKACRYVSKIY